MKAHEEVMGIVQEFHDALRAVYGGRLEGVYLYGSYARDGAGKDTPINIGSIELSGQFGENLEWENVISDNGGIVVKITTAGVETAAQLWHLYE